MPVRQGRPLSGLRKLPPDQATHPQAEVTTPVTAVVSAFRHLNCRRIGFVTPYIPDVSLAIRDFLEQNGLTIANLVSFEQSSEAVVASITPDQCWLPSMKPIMMMLTGCSCPVPTCTVFQSLIRRRQRSASPSSHQIWRWPGICCDWPMLTGRMRRCPGVCLAAPADRNPAGVGYIVVVMAMPPRTSTSAPRLSISIFS